MSFRPTRRIAAAATMTLALLAAPLAAPTTSADAQASSTVDGQLRIGGLFPQTGDLSFFEPQIDAAARLAVQRINNAGGVLGRSVQWIPTDSGSFDTATLDASSTTLLNRNVDAVVGPLSSTQTLRTINRFTPEGRVVVSPTATAMGLSNVADRGRFFRTAGSDALQAKAIVDHMIRSGHDRIMLLGRNDNYGNTLGNSLARQGRIAGLQVFHVRYNPDAPNPANLARLTANKNPDAVVIAGFDETSSIIKALAGRNVRSTNTLIHLTDGNSGDSSNDLTGLDRALFAGVQGIIPGTRTSNQLGEALLRLDPELTEGAYSSETYDAVMVLALAAEQAGSDDPAKIASEIPKVTRRGVICTNFIRCRALIRRGTNIDYQGQAGPLTMSAGGDLVTARFNRVTFDRDGVINTANNTTQTSSFLFGPSR